LQSTPAILATESGKTGSPGLVCEGMEWQVGPPVGDGPGVGCRDGDDEVGDAADPFG